MSAPKRVDLAILGAGCAGLSLARELAKRHVQRSVVIIEPRQTYQDDRSWCFWESDQHALSDWVSHHWPQWLFGREGEPAKTRSCANHKYQYIRSGDFYRESLAALDNHPSINLQTGVSVLDLIALDASWQITTSDATYIADQVVDTRPPEKKLSDQAPLLQCFLGVEIKLKPPSTIDPSTAELMTDMRMVNDEFCFTYVLPFAPNHLLAEVTFFARQPPSRAELQTQLTQLLTKRGWTEAQILRTEYGELPMGLPATSKYSPNQPLLAGMRGGALRPSSGYGFLRIQRWAEQCAQRYCEQARLVPQTTSGFWLQKMDLLFLAVLRKDPALAPELFDRLFGNTETERFIRFMDDRASLSDCLHIVACLPKTPFLKALFSSFPLLFRRQA